MFIFIFLFYLKKIVAGGNERRTVHIGMDLMVESGHAIFAPFSGVIHSFQDNNNLLDYGPAIILLVKFFTFFF